ncbi:MAG: CoA transferase [Deltaproteobacteria bacterium]|nr:CoA transferase [Deltaproteobacteria bacterium]
MEIHQELRGPLHGVKVVDLSHVQSGPICTMLLGDMGAEVIKVESFAGDQFRLPMEGAHFVNFNRNKRGIALDLKKGEGKEIVLRLAKKADVFVENFLPGALERLGLGYDTIRQLNPRIIYCSISGFGQIGPYRERPAYEPILQAMSGIMDTTGEPDRPPVRIRPAMIDYCTAMNAAFGIAVSLIEREKTGQGQRIDVALLDVAINAMSPYVTQFKRTGELPKRAGSSQPTAAPFQAFETGDGLIYIGAATDEMWQNLCRALGLEDLSRNPRYATRQGRIEHREELAEELNKVTKRYRSQDLESKLLAVDVPCAKIRTIGEIIQEPHVQSRGILEEVDYPIMGKIMTIKTPIFFSGGPPTTRWRAPLLGEHTREVLIELGYSHQEIQDLINRRIAVQYEP